MGVSNLPEWASQDGFRVTHPYADRKGEMLPGNADFDWAPSTATILARIENACIEAAAPPTGILIIILVARWITLGFRRFPN